MLPTISEGTLDLEPGTEVLLRQQTWEDYETLLERRQDNAALKITFDAATREIRIMAPLPGHGHRSAALMNFVQAMLIARKKDWSVYHPTTLKRFRQKGVEPDTCLYIQNAQAVLGKDRIDLEIDPPPDLVLEVDLTSLTKIEDYEPIGVPEVWIYQSAELSIYLFDGQHYQLSTESSAFPEIPVKQLIPKYVERGWAVPSSVALKEFQAELQRLG
ncbi:Uma2 family endonuclease [Synechococcus sp. PCC 7336]|uniref:Uma2 family endonuclease n=1 Tax=Synechococcus sp. PCC 7336 TaxID=195250 RepID=UPI0003702DAF|nr:Uma2 family endonuclease [Synechococcus sp. PCC 7336]